MPMFEVVKKTIDRRDMWPLPELWEATGGGSKQMHREEHVGDIWLQGTLCSCAGSLQSKPLVLTPENMNWSKTRETISGDFAIK